MRQWFGGMSDNVCQALFSIIKHHHLVCLANSWRHRLIVTWLWYAGNWRFGQETSAGRWYFLLGFPISFAWPGCPRHQGSLCSRSVQGPSTLSPSSPRFLHGNWDQIFFRWLWQGEYCKQASKAFHQDDGRASNERRMLSVYHGWVDPVRGRPDLLIFHHLTFTIYTIRRSNGYREKATLSSAGVRGSSRGTTNVGGERGTGVHFFSFWQIQCEKTLLLRGLFRSFQILPTKWSEMVFLAKAWARSTRCLVHLYWWPCFLVSWRRIMFCCWRCSTF